MGLVGYLQVNAHSAHIRSMVKPAVSAVRFKLLDNEPKVGYVVTDAGRLSRSAFGNVSLSPAGFSPDALAHRKVAANVLQTQLSHCIFMQQRHTNHIATVDSSHAGLGAFSYDSALPATDGLATVTPGLALFALAADCQPILLYAPDVNAIAAIHCGWRGTLLNMPLAAVTTMANAYGARPDRLIACLAPCIGPQAFEVKEDVASLFRKSHPSIPLLPHPTPEKHYINLPDANRTLLLRAGLRPERIEEQTICTYSSWPRFFSARRGDTGRFAVGIVLYENK